jgi:ABC-type dipeptide/oligopeptide/nickel transport system permease component
MQARHLLPLLLRTAIRIGRTLLVLLGVLTLVFAVVRAVPGDPALAILGEQAPPEELARLRAEMGLELPLHEQYTRYLGQVLDGTLGKPWSRAHRQLNVADLIGEVLPYTFELALAAVLVAMLIALPLGLLAALRRNRPTDHLALIITLVGIAMPGFWLGPLLIHLLCVRVGLFPDPAAGVQGLPSLVLPAFVLGLALSAKLTRMVRSSVLDVLEQPYVLAARARGIPEGRIILRHVLRNALIPVTTVIGLQFAALLSGAIITEKVFARPGLGMLLLEGIAQRDYAIVQGTALFIGIIYVGVNLVVDLLYVVIDPRIAHTFARGGR